MPDGTGTCELDKNATVFTKVRDFLAVGFPCQWQGQIMNDLFEFGDQAHFSGLIFQDSLTGRPRIRDQEWNRP